MSSQGRDRQAGGETGGEKEQGRVKNSPLAGLAAAGRRAGQAARALAARPGVARQLYMMDYALKSMQRRKWRNLVLLAVYMLIIFLLASVMMFASAIRHEAALLLADAPALTVQKLRMGRHDLISGRNIARLSRIRGVQRAEGRLWGYFYDGGTGANFTLMVPLRSAAPDMRPRPGEVMVGEGVARVKNLKEGGYLFMLSSAGHLSKLKVKKIFTRQSALLSSDLVLLNERDFRAFYQLPRKLYTDIVLTIRNPREIAKITEKASRLLPAGRFVSRKDIMRTYESIFSWREGILLVLLVSSIIAFALLAFDRASGLSGEERREIGILKALGWESSSIIAMKFWEGALISLAAYIFGAGLAWAHVFYFSAGLLEPVLKGWAVIYPHFRLAPHIGLLDLASLAFFTILPYSAATIVPIWRAAITDPDEVMR